MATFVKALSQEEQEQLVEQIDFDALRNAVTANAKQAQDMLDKYKGKGTFKSVHAAMKKGKRQDILLKISRSANIYTTALVSILVHAIAMTNTAM